MKSFFKVFILVFTLGIVAAFLLSSDLFSIKNIYVTGNKTVPKNEIIKLSNIQYNQNIFKLNTKEVMKGIFENPKIKAVRIKRVLPSSIALDIIEREGVALIPYLGSYINIDEETVIIEVISLEDNLHLPKVHGITFSDFKIGEKLKSENQEQLDNVMEVLKYLKNVKMTDMIETIDVGDSSNIIITTTNNIRVYLGNNKLDYKISMAKSIIEDLNKDNEVGIVDMRHEGNPIFKRD
ncbi:cell division protein FtsQ/DivIB [Lutispora thermophila]|uniref:Cell division protein FtsQ n=1 Tax=Lutispora thermophila DSM 19022 TaxID=1122184 RepID=A0A1M6CN03_9FIRM|nr:FtsQ-type POTRA domain-containing protein [Lutispora thermophila]SHI62415.1 cell division protein FtsQ [Lutispora thermophila DSM 19022]